MQLALHRVVVDKLVENPGSVRATARENIERMRPNVRGSQAHGWLDEWQILLDGPPSRLIETMLAPGEHAVDLRQVSPFAGV